jgi:hypothetical protein
MRYLVVEANHAQTLQAKVQHYIGEGWEPLGGLSVATYGAINWWYYQAMIIRQTT